MRQKPQQNNSPAGTKVNEKREGGSAPSTGAEVTLQPMEKAVLRQVVLLQLMEDCIRADIHCAKLHAEAGEQCEEEGQAESKCYMDWSQTPFLHPPVLFGGEGGREESGG